MDNAIQPLNNWGEVLNPLASYTRAFALSYTFPLILVLIVVTSQTFKEEWGHVFNMEDRTEAGRK